MSTSKRFADAVAEIDALNADDPERISVRGETGPKELLHAALVTEWVRRLRPEASEALLLAARAHHVRRWEIPRASHPPGRSSYLRWRRTLQAFHARSCGEVLQRHGYAADEIGHVARLIEKRDLASDPEAQVLEDAICLVFLETQAHDFARREPEKVDRILRLTLRKMSESGRREAGSLDVSRNVASGVERALASLMHS